MKDWIAQTAAGIDQFCVECRIRDLAHYALGDRSDRLGRIAATLSRLDRGQYLIGVGPHLSGIIRVGAMEIRIGRAASLLESPLDEVLDFEVNDAALTGPREVSRLHMSVCQNPAAIGILVRDESSTTGTWILPDQERLEAGRWTSIELGQAISLGPSGVNLFMPLVVE